MTYFPLRILLVIFLIVVNGLFAGAEVALLSVRQSRLRQLSSWTTIWSAMQCANALTSMLAKWSGTGWRNLICAPSHGLSHVARNLRIWDFPPRL